MRFRLAAIGLIVLALALFALPVSAQERSVTVPRRDADITINPDGSVEVVETWEVRFHGGPFRFAFREIPGDKVSAITVQGVSENGTPFKSGSREEPGTYKVEANASNRTLTWYFTPAENETRVFELRYVLKDALRIYEDGDQFWWKFIEADRSYPIESSRVRIKLPGAFDPNEILAAAYLNGDETSGARVLDDGTLEFEGGPFPAGTEWELRAQFPHGVVTQPLQRWQEADDRIASAEEQSDRVLFFSLFASFLVLIGGGLGLLLVWYLIGRDPPTALAAEHLPAPPDALPPALVGALLDERADVHDVLSTLVDWARRGLIRIEERARGAATASPDDDFVWKLSGDPSALQYQYERELMQRLFGSETERSIGHIRRQFTNALESMFDSLYDELVRSGYFTARPDRIRTRFMQLGVVMLLLIVPACVVMQIALNAVLAVNDPVYLPWCALGVIVLAFLFLSRYLPRKTRQGAEAAAKWKAFRRYLEHIEKYTKLADAKELFDRYLPYAVAFGLDKTWVEKFAVVDTPAPTWFVPVFAPGKPVPSAPRESSRPHTGGRPASPSSGPVFPPIGEAPFSGSAGPVSTPSLDSAASGAFNSLNSISSSLFRALNSTASAFVSSNPDSGRRSTTSYGRRSSSFRSSSSFSGSRSSRSFSGGGSRGGRGGGGGRSGFG